MRDGRWLEVGERVFARRYAELDLTVGLVIGAERCLVIDTRGDAAQGGELAEAVRTLTPHPWTVVLTHAHFDHSFGTSAFLPCDVWAHERCHADLLAHGASARDEWARRYRDDGRPDIAEHIGATEIVLPNRRISDTADPADPTALDIGGRAVELLHPGPAHTDHDVAVHVPDAGVVFAGDLIEHDPRGSFTAESFGPDSHLTSWPDALGQLLTLRPATVVAGHGEPVDRDFVATQREELTLLAELCAAGDETVALRRSPYPEDVTRAALRATSRAGGAAAGAG